MGLPLARPGLLHGKSLHHRPLLDPDLLGRHCVADAADAAGHHPRVSRRGRLHRSRGVGPRQFARIARRHFVPRHCAADVRDRAAAPPGESAQGAGPGGGDRRRRDLDPAGHHMADRHAPGARFALGPRRRHGAQPLLHGRRAPSALPTPRASVALGADVALDSGRSGSGRDRDVDVPAGARFLGRYRRSDSGGRSRSGGRRSGIVDPGCRHSARRGRRDSHRRSARVAPPSAGIRSRRTLGGDDDRRHFRGPGRRVGDVSGRLQPGARGLPLRA